MSLSLIAKSIKASPTLKLNEKFAILKEKGDPVIHLGGGEPKTRVPMDAILATVALTLTREKYDTHLQTAFLRLSKPL